MHRFYLPRALPGREEVPLSPADARKVCRVLKLVPGDEVLLWDETGVEYRALITRVEGRKVTVRVLEQLQNTAESPLLVNLIQGIPKGDKLELIIQKATELGVRRIYPVITSRTVVRIPQERELNRLQRWQAIAREAARQCGRVRIPEIAAPAVLEDLWERLEPEALKLICWEQEQTGLKAYLRKLGQSPSAPIYLLVGPEGGLSPQEVERCGRRGGVPVSLGPRILRTETAGLIALSLVLYEWGDLGGL